MTHKAGQGKGKAIPIEDWTGPEGFKRKGSQISRQSAHEVGKVVNLTYRPALTPGNIPGTHLYQRLSRPRGHSAAGRVMPMISVNDTIGNRTRAVFQTAAPRRALRAKAAAV